MAMGQRFPTGNSKRPPTHQPQKAASGYGGNNTKQVSSRVLKPTLASGTGGNGNQLQKMAKNRLRRLNG